MRPEKLLRWYPRAWRERYGGELLALIQDWMDEDRPTWRLRLGVIGGGLRERAHQAVRAAKAAAKTPAPIRWAMAFAAGVTFVNLPQNLAHSSLQARGWQATAALDAVLAAAALTVALVLACGLVGLPALVRFLRAGGWPKIRRLAACAAGASVAAGGGLAGVALAVSSHSSAQLSASLAYVAGLSATWLALAVAIGLWGAAAAAAAKNFTRASRARAAQLVLGAVLPSAVMAMVVTVNLWWSTTQSRAWLVPALVLLGMATMSAWLRIPPAVRRGRRLRAAASGATMVNPSAQRTHGRHRA